MRFKVVKQEKGDENEDKGQCPSFMWKMWFMNGSCVVQAQDTGECNKENGGKTMATDTFGLNWKAVRARNERIYSILVITL